MKRIIFLIITLILGETVYAQIIDARRFAYNDVTTFLGIPVDGTKAEMKKKLIDKGFVQLESESDCLAGEFNGEIVYLFIYDNNNKVKRIMLVDAYKRSEEQIKIRYNKLINQFMNNERYFDFNENSELTESEDISYEMSTHNKQYTASFYQFPNMEKFDTSAFQMAATEELLKKFTEEQIQSKTDDVLTEQERLSTSAVTGIMLRKNVWFTIGEIDGKYRILLFYDNKYNEANGEDL